MFIHYLKVALRNLLKYKMQTFISIIGVSLGVVCFSACTYFLRTIHRGDDCFPEFHKMVKLYTVDGDREFELRGEPTVQFRKHFADVIERVAIYGYREHNTISLTGEEEGKESYVRAYGTNVNGDFMTVYPPQLIEGSLERFINQPNAVLVSEEFAQRMFGSKPAVGTTFSMGGAKNTLCTIVGIVKAYPPMTSFSYKPVDFFRRMSEETLAERSQYSMTLLLQPGMDLKTLNERLKGVDLSSGEHPVKGQLRTLREKKKLEPMAVVISVVGFLVMLTGLLNFMNFSIGAFFAKDRELHLRETVGAKRKHLFYLLFTELACVLVAVFLLSMSFVELILPVLHHSLPADMRQELSMNFGDIGWQICEYFVYIMALCVLLAGISVWRIKRQTASGMAFRSRSIGKHRLRNTMLGVQFFICMVFLFATGASYLSTQVARANMSGSFLDKEGRERILYFRVGAEELVQQHWPEIKRFVQSSPYYDSYALSNPYITSYVNHKQEGIDYTIRIVSPSYIEMMGFPVKKLPDAGKPYCIINREMERYLQQDSMDYVPFNGKDHPVHDVVDLTEYYYYLPQATFFVEDKEVPDWLYVRVRPGVDVEQAHAALQEKLDYYLPKYSATQVMTLNDNETTSAYVILEKLFLTCALISICITIMGLLGAITMDTRRRQKEVAIRKINGAGMRSIYWLFGRLYLLIFGVTAAIATLLSLLAFTFVSQQTDSFFDYSNPWYWLCTLLAAAVVIVVTISWQIYRISRLNPGEIIKSE